MNGKRVIWSGNDYGWQSPQQHTKLKNSGQFRVGRRELDQIGRALAPAIDKVQEFQRRFRKATDRVPGVKALERLANRAVAADDQLPSSVVAQGGARVAQVAADKANLDPRIGMALPFLLGSVKVGGGAQPNWKPGSGGGGRTRPSLSARAQNAVDAADARRRAAAQSRSGKPGSVDFSLPENDIRQAVSPIPGSKVSGDLGSTGRRFQSSAPTDPKRRRLDLGRQADRAEALNAGSNTVAATGAKALKQPEPVRDLTRQTPGGTTKNLPPYTTDVSALERQHGSQHAELAKGVSKIGKELARRSGNPNHPLRRAPLTAPWTGENKLAQQNPQAIRRRLARRPGVGERAAARELNLQRIKDEDIAIRLREGGGVPSNSLRTEMAGPIRQSFSLSAKQRQQLAAMSPSQRAKVRARLREVGLRDFKPLPTGRYQQGRARGGFNDDGTPKRSVQAFGYVDTEQAARDAAAGTRNQLRARDNGEWLDGQYKRLGGDVENAKGDVDYQKQFLQTPETEFRGENRPTPKTRQQIKRPGSNKAPERPNVRGTRDGRTEPKPLNRRTELAADPTRRGKKARAPGGRASATSRTVKSGANHISNDSIQKAQKGFEASAPQFGPHRAGRRPRLAPIRNTDAIGNAIRYKQRLDNSARPSGKKPYDIPHNQNIRVRSEDDTVMRKFREIFDKRGRVVGIEYTNDLQSWDKSAYGPPKPPNRAVVRSKNGDGTYTVAEGNLEKLRLDNKQSAGYYTKDGKFHPYKDKRMQQRNEPVALSDKERTPRSKVKGAPASPVSFTKRGKGQRNAFPLRRGNAVPGSDRAVDAQPRGKAATVSELRASLKQLEQAAKRGMDTAAVKAEIRRIKARIDKATQPLTRINRSPKVNEQQGRIKSRLEKPRKLDKSTKATERTKIQRRRSENNDESYIREFNKEFSKENGKVINRTQTGQGLSTRGGAKEQVKLNAGAKTIKAENAKKKAARSGLATNGQRKSRDVMTKAEKAAQTRAANALAKERSAMERIRAARARRRKAT